MWYNHWVSSSTKTSTRLAVCLLCPYHPKWCLEVSWLCPNKHCVQILLKMSNINLHMSHLVVGTIGWWQNVVGVREIIFAPGSCWVENRGGDKGGQEGEKVSRVEVNFWPSPPPPPQGPSTGGTNGGVQQPFSGQPTISAILINILLIIRRMRVEDKN